MGNIQQKKEKGCFCVELHGVRGTTLKLKAVHKDNSRHNDMLNHPRDV